MLSSLWLTKADKMVTSSAHSITDLSIERNNDTTTSSSNKNNMNDNNSNDDDNNCRSSNKLSINFNIRKSTYAILSFLLVVSYLLALVQGAAIYSTPTNPNFESLCHTQQERFIDSDGKESSLILELRPGAYGEKRKSCTRILSAPNNYGFIVRLIIPKLRHRSGLHHGTAVGPVTPVEAAAVTVAGSPAGTAAPLTPALTGMTSLIEKLNTTAYKAAAAANTRTCPLSIFSSLDPHTPQWRVDPCQLEDTAPEMEDPVRLFHGRLRVVWEHRQQKLHSKLMITALGKDEQCRKENKHPCLKIENEPILCISKDLVCDGIRHCPYRNDVDSDEDTGMCWQRRRIGDSQMLPAAMETDIFEHFAFEVFRNWFAFDGRPEAEPNANELLPIEGGVSGVIEERPTNATTTMLQKVPPQGGGSKTQKKNPLLPSDEDETVTTATANATASANATTTTTTGHGHRRNSTRLGLNNSDLSKYGPWGYLMLGMLLCGGALLICGLWASASQHAANNERESAMQSAGASSLEHTASNAAPPNYEELDPPPAYSVLFPNQKAGSNATLNSMAATTLMATPSISLLSEAGGSGGRASGGAAAAAFGSSVETTTSSLGASQPTSATGSGHPQHNHQHQHQSQES